MKRPMIALTVMICIAFAIAVFLPAAGPVQAGSASNANAQDGTDLSKAEAYCVKKGGEVDARKPYFNTNDDETELVPSFREIASFASSPPRKMDRGFTFCFRRFTAEKPTLAALAYYAEVPYGGNCNGNPASCYCSQLGGSDLFGGINLNGGGWVMKSDLVDTVLEACIFPDMSSIDSWGLTYHQAEIIRGKNLANVLRYPNPYGTK